MSGRLVDKSPSQGCVLCDLHTPIPTEIPSVSGEDVPLHLSPFWPLIGPMGIHKDPEASSVNPAAAGCPDDRLHR